MCQIQTSFWSCGQFAEGKTILCSTYQVTQGKCCDGFSSFCRMIYRPCPNCLAGKPHPQSQELSASIAVQDPVPRPVPIPEAKTIPETRNPADMLNVIDSAAMAPPPKNPVQRVKQQHQAAPVKKLAPKSVPTPSRISAKGGIQKSVPAPAHRQSSRRLLPVAETVTSVSSSPKRSPTEGSHLVRKANPAGSSNGLEMSPSSIESLNFLIDPALIAI
ncbi:MAG: hypothetical protein Q9195_005074 [Heterodermia aff. obscurata]